MTLLREAPTTDRRRETATVEIAHTSPLGGSYVTCLTSTASESAYVTTSSLVRRPRRGSYVTASGSVESYALGTYADISW